MALLELTAERQLEEVRAGRLNVGFEVITTARESDNSLNILPIMEESLVVAMPELHPLAFQQQVFLRDLIHQKLILPSIDEFPFYKQFIYYCQQAGFEPNIIRDVRATWLVTMLSLVVAEVGLAILPSNVQNLQRRGVVYRSIQDTNLRRQISAVWRKDDSSVVLAEFLKVVTELSDTKLPN